MTVCRSVAVCQLKMTAGQNLCTRASRKHGIKYSQSVSYTWARQRFNLFTAYWPRIGLVLTRLNSPTNRLSLRIQETTARDKVNQFQLTKTFLIGCFLLVLAECAVATVTFEGLDVDQELNARAIIPLASADCSSARWRIERLFRDADNDLRVSLEALGYYELDISKTLQFDDDCWQAHFDVKVGDPVILSSVEIDIAGEAADDSAYLALARENQPKSGEILNHGRYESFKRALVTSAISRGYFDAELSRSDVAVDTEKRTASMAITVATGARYRFGEVTFTDGILQQSLLNGFSDIRSGDYYHANAISGLYDVLNGSTYFAGVTITTEPLDVEHKTVPVTVALEPGTRKIYSVGAGFTTDTGPHGRLGYTNRRRNERGHQFDSKLFISSVKSELSASYRWPKRDPRKEWFDATVGIQHEDTATSESDIYKVGFQRTRALGSSWLETRYADYAHEQFKVGDQDTSSKLVILGANWEATWGQQLSRVDRGLRLSFNLRGASDSLGSDTRFAQFNFAAKWIHSLSQNTRLLARTAVGVTEKEDLAELPVSVRLFAGGDRSVRGYDFKTLGPVDAEGLVIGGGNLLEASLEFDYAFKPQWAIAAFVDTGSAFNDFDVDFSTGLGLGLRWYSPVGPVRLDLAHPLDDPDQKVRVHISLGLDL